MNTNFATNTTHSANSSYQGFTSGVSTLATSWYDPPTWTEGDDGSAGVREPRRPLKPENGDSVALVVPA